MYFIGQKENLEIIDKWKTLPNFLIIQGDKHTGKEYLVSYLCNKFKLYYNKLDIKVDSIRDVINNLTKGSKNVYHLKNFNEASTQAKNVLLKITEEPVEGNYFVITGGPQIKTLESRAKRLIMSPYTEEELKSYMEPYYPDSNLQRLLIDVGINSPAKIEYYKKYDKIEGISNFAQEIFNKLTYISIEDIVYIMKRFENRYGYEKNDVDACLLFMIMLINLIEQNLKTKHYFSYQQHLNILTKSKNELIFQPTLKRKMLLYTTFYQIYLSNKVH